MSSALSWLADAWHTTSNGASSLWSGIVGWFNVDRAGILIALAGLVATAWYARRQARITVEAKEEARRSADAAERSADAAERSADIAEQQTRIAEQAKNEARRAADAAAAAAAIEARREHHAGAYQDLQLVAVEIREHSRTGRDDLWVVINNTGPRAYRYNARVVHSPNSYMATDFGTVDAGETISVHIGSLESSWQGVELWVNGDCPCNQPDGPDGHWRCWFPAREPDEDPNDRVLRSY